MVRLINQSIIIVLQIIGASAFILLGMLFISDGRIVAGAGGVALASGWLFLTVRRYMKQKKDLESLR
jgi:hypothetical protein